MARPTSPAITLQDEELDRFFESSRDDEAAGLLASADRGEIGLSARPQQPFFQDVVYEVVPNPRGPGNILRYVGPAEGRPLTSAAQPPPPVELDPNDLFEFDPRFLAVQRRIEELGQQLSAYGWPARLTEKTPDGFEINYDPAERLVQETLEKNPTIGKSWQHVIAQRARRHWDLDRLAFQTVEPHRSGFRGIVREGLGHAFPRIQAEVAARVRSPEDREIFLRNVAKWVRHLRAQSADPNQMSLSSSAVLGAVGGITEVSEVLGRLSGLLKLEPEEAKLLSEAAGIESGTDPTSGMTWAVREAARFGSQQAVSMGFASALRLRHLANLVAPVVRFAQPAAARVADFALRQMGRAPHLAGQVLLTGQRAIDSSAAIALRHAAVKASKWFASMSAEANLPVHAAYWTAMIWPKTYEQYLRTMDPRTAYWTSFGSSALQAIVELWEPAPLKLLSERYAGKMIQSFLVSTLKEVGEEGVQAFIDYWAQTSGNIASRGRVTLQDLRELPHNVVESVKQAADAVFYSLAPIALMVGAPAAGGAALARLGRAGLIARKWDQAKREILTDPTVMNVIFGALDQENLVDLALGGPSRTNFRRYLGEAPYNLVRFTKEDRDTIYKQLVDYLLKWKLIVRTPDGRLARPTAAPQPQTQPPEEQPPPPPPETPCLLYTSPSPRDS